MAALVKSAQPSLTAAEMRTALTGTAVDIMSPGFDRDSGNGIVMAWEAINSLGVTGVANPELGTITASENPGNGNGVIEAGEGASLVIQLKNTGGVQAVTGVTATLTSSTPGVIITQPGTSSYADMAAGASGSNNLSPFTFTLASNYPCGQPADFTLTVNYTGGRQRALNFTLSVGLFSLSNNLGSTPPTVPGITTATGTEVNRINRNGVVSACGTPKAFPGAITGSFIFDSYTFTACQAACIDVNLISSGGINLFESAYSPSFNPASIGTNYQGDSGLSGSDESFGITTAASTPYTIVVNDVTGTSSGTAYTLQIPACALDCNVNHLPVAQAHDVSVVAISGTTANASIDNGSYDPDAGDTITLTQGPPGPYPVGVTNVLLTVVDSKGATAQATANVTVIAGSITVVPGSSTAQVVAGRSTVITLTVTGNANFPGPATAACSTTAPLVTCRFSPAAPTIGTTASQISVTIQTVGPLALNRRPSWPGRSKAVFATLLGLPMFVFTLAGCRGSRKRRGWWIWVGSFFLLLLLLAGCGSSSAQPFTTPGTYAVQMTISEGSTQGSATVNITVTQ